MPDSNARIEALAREFVEQLKAIAKDELVSLLGPKQDNGPGLSAERGGSRENGAARRRARAAGEKRSPEEMEGLQRRVVEHLQLHPEGLRVEQLNEALGMASGELARPIKKLIAARAVRATGTRRATRYTVSARTGRTGKRRKNAGPREVAADSQ